MNGFGDVHRFGGCDDLGIGKGVGVGSDQVWDCLRKPDCVSDHCLFAAIVHRLGKG